MNKEQIEIEIRRYKRYVNKSEDAIDNYNAKMTPQEVADCIDYQPTAYDVEKVVAELEDASVGTGGVRIVTLPTVIEIVRKGGV